MFATLDAFRPPCRDPLHGLQALTARVAVYVPTTIHAEPAPAAVIDDNRDLAARTLAALFGGFTEVAGHGGWFGQSGRLIRESVFITFSACTPEALAENLDAVITLAGSIAVAMDQEAVTVEVNGSIYFVPQPVVKANAKRVHAALVT